MRVGLHLLSRKSLLVQRCLLYSFIYLFSRVCVPQCVFNNASFVSVAVAVRFVVVLLSKPLINAVCHVAPG